METAILTVAGARRIGRPDLAGCIVQYDYLMRNTVAHNVYYNGRKIASYLSCVSTAGTNDAGLHLCPPAHKWTCPDPTPGETKFVA